MKEKTLLRICLVCSLVGIFTILLISDRITLEYSDIANISKKDLEKRVKVNGTVTNSHETPGLIILNLKDDTGDITVIIFKEGNITLKENRALEIEGKVIEYKGKLEIQADLIRMA